MTAQTRSDIVELLERHGLSPIHRLGQHFLADANVTRKIVRLANLTSASRVVEIGAGTGTLTNVLATTGARVVAYEIDRGLIGVLEEVAAAPNVEIRHADITDVDLTSALDGQGWVMVANLPYNVGTPLVIETLMNTPVVERFVVMVQVEVARRFVSDVGDSDYGLPSVVARIYTESELAFTVSPQVFHPQPRVDSAVMVMRRKPTPDHAKRAVELARAGFGQRRKMLRGSLKAVLENADFHLATVGLDPTARAEDLSASEWLRMAEGS